MQNNGQNNGQNKECYAVIFTSTQHDHTEGYEAAAMEMAQLAMQQKGFLGIDHAHMGKTGITISYWESEQAILDWKNNPRHQLMQERGKKEWYKRYNIRVAKVLRDYGSAT